MPQKINTNDLSHIDPYYGEFFEEMGVKDILALVNLSDDLNIEKLNNVACAKIASLMKGKNVTVIRQVFDIENDFTYEEENDIRDDNRWSEKTRVK